MPSSDVKEPDMAAGESGLGLFDTLVGGLYTSREGSRFEDCLFKPMFGLSSLDSCDLTDVVR